MAWRRENTKARNWINDATGERMSRRQGDKKLDQGILKKQGFTSYEQKRDVRKSAGIPKGERVENLRFSSSKQRGTTYLELRNIAPKDIKAALDNYPKSAEGVILSFNITAQNKDVHVSKFAKSASRSYMKREVQAKLNSYDLRKAAKDAKIKLIPTSFGPVPDGLVTFNFLFVEPPPPGFKTPGRKKK